MRFKILVKILRNTWIGVASLPVCLATNLKLCLLNELKDENSFQIGYRDVHSIFSDLQCFSGTSFSENNLIGKKNTLWENHGEWKSFQIKDFFSREKLENLGGLEKSSKTGSTRRLDESSYKTSFKKEKSWKKNRKKSNRTQKQAYVLLFFKGSVEYDCNNKIYKC